MKIYILKEMIDWLKHRMFFCLDFIYTLQFPPNIIINYFSGSYLMG